MEQQMYYLISDAAKQVEVESHVLRYWEEELGIPIKRNELGHRYYTKEDVERFREIKNLKEQGLQLKAIRMVLRDGKLERLTNHEIQGNAVEYPEKKERETAEDNAGEKEAVKGEGGEEKQMIEIIASKDITDAEKESKEEKGIRLQMLLQHMIGEAVRENNRELCNDIKECVLKEMDYQFRLQEEREEARAEARSKKEDEHYRKIDELLRSCTRKGKKNEGDKQSRFTVRKKPSIV